MTLKSHNCTEGMDVYVAGISVKVARITRGDLLFCQSAIVVERRRDGAGEVSRGHSRSATRTEGPKPVTKYGILSVEMKAVAATDIEIYRAFQPRKKRNFPWGWIE